MENAAWREQMRTDVEAPRGEIQNVQPPSVEAHIESHDSLKALAYATQVVGSGVTEDFRNSARHSLLAFADQSATLEASMEPGTVVVIEQDGALQQSHYEYDGRVIGVVVKPDQSAQALILGRQRTQSTRIPIALLGQVYCKVDAEFSPIEPGDILTTSPTAGHAMKAANEERARGAKIGTALSRLPQGRGLIPVSLAVE